MRHVELEHVETRLLRHGLVIGDAVAIERRIARPAAQCIAEKLVLTEPCFPDVWQYMSTHPAEGDDPWYENTYVKDPAGNVMEFRVEV